MIHRDQLGRGKVKRNNMEQATPRPWKIRHFRDEEPLIGFFIEAQNPAQPYNIEILCEDTGGYPVEQRYADAELIVNAVNQFDSLQAENARLLISISELESAKLESEKWHTSEFFRIRDELLSENKRLRDALDGLLNRLPKYFDPGVVSV